MKSLLSILFLFIIISSVTAQESSEKDAELREYFVGVWSHETSVYPNGEVLDYYQEFEFKEDGTGFCYQLEGELIIYLNVKWSIVDGKVYLYSFLSNDDIVLSDVILIGHMDADHFTGDKIFGPASERKTCLYTRKDRELV